MKRCIMCGCEIIQNPCAVNMNGKGYRNAVVGNITANYGSAYVGVCFSVAICDWCINANMDKITVITEDKSLKNEQ